MSWKDAGYLLFVHLEECIAASKQSENMRQYNGACNCPAHVIFTASSYNSAAKWVSRFSCLLHWSRCNCCCYGTLQEFRRRIWIIFSKASELFQMVWTEITVPRLTGNQRHRPNATTLQTGTAQNKEEYFRVNVFYPFLDYMLTELNDRWLCHRTTAFSLQCLAPKFTQTSSLIDTQPAIKIYQKVLSGTTFDVEAEFVLWRA